MMHALIGGLAGAVVAHAGLAAFNWNNLVGKVLIPLVASPLLGFTAAFLFMIGLLWLARMMRPAQVQRTSRRLQLVSACMMAFSHGSNDAQKAMGIITLALVSFMAAGYVGMPAAMLPVGDAIPTWVIFSCAAAIGLGTMAGGKRIIKTMGTKIIRISPLQGFAAETAGTATILTASAMGVPVSTTHCISACIMGVGASKRLSAVRWGVAGNIVMAWVLTIPMSAGFAFLAVLGLRAVFGAET
jgi:PiT family inorganic phosphate transporter